MAVVDPCLIRCVDAAGGLSPTACRLRKSDWSARRMVRMLLRSSESRCDCLEA
jgi:hypothetical protein